MAEYIAREVVLQKVKKLQETDPAVIGKKQFADGYFLGLDELEVILRGTPAAEAVEVVRCEKCRYVEPCICVVCEDGDTVLCTKLLRHMPKNHFCAYGERKDNGTT